ncbi:MAG: ArsR/SmtB family transcription factor [Azonexus sp.]
MTPRQDIPPSRQTGDLPRLPAPLSGLQRAEAEFGTIARCLQAIGHPLSLRILCLLSGGEASVGEVQARLGKPLPTISLHLHKLADRGILEARSAGNRVYFTLRSPHIRRLVEGIRTNFLN